MLKCVQEKISIILKLFVCLHLFYRTREPSRKLEQSHDAARCDKSGSTESDFVLSAFATHTKKGLEISFPTVRNRLPWSSERRFLWHTKQQTRCSCLNSDNIVWLHEIYHMENIFLL